MGTGSPLSLGTGTVCSYFIPARSWGNSPGSLSLTPTEVLEPRASSLASRTKRGVPPALGRRVRTSPPPAGKAPTSCSPRLGYGEAATASVGQTAARRRGGVDAPTPWLCGAGSLPAGHQGLVRTRVWSSGCRGLSQVRFTWPTSASRPHPLCLARKRFSKPQG